MIAIHRGRLQFAHPFEQWIADAHRLPEMVFEPVSAEIAQLAGSFGDEMHGDPADRIIAATAITLGGTVLTADEKLQACPKVATSWYFAAIGLRRCGPMGRTRNAGTQDFA